MKLTRKLTIIIIVSAFFTFVIWNVANRYNCNSSFYSFVGGALGGIISGTFAFLGVHYTIRYYKDSDLEKERKSIQPFLLATLLKPGDKPSNSIYSLLGADYIEKVRTSKTLDFKIKNIGNGFARATLLESKDSNDEFDYNVVFDIGYTECFALVISDKDICEKGAKFRLWFYDSMSNEYYQEYTIKKNAYDEIIVENGYPILITDGDK